MGLTVGDYVQQRDTGIRGDVVKIDHDGWIVVHSTNGPDEFFMDHKNYLIRLLRKDQIGDL